MKRFAQLAAAAAVLFFGSCESMGDEPMAAGNVVNEDCILMADHEVDPGVTREFGGMEVGFCCEKCGTKWDEMADADKQAKIDGLDLDK